MMPELLNSIQIIERQGVCSSAVNPPFQSARWVDKYCATQPLIVPVKEVVDALNGELTEQLRRGSGRAFRLFVPGVGPGSLVARFLADVVPRASSPVHVTCMDLSDRMIERCRQNIVTRAARHEMQHPCRVELYSRVDLVHPECAEVEQVVAEQGPFDAIVALQFDHYFPNSDTSELAVRFQAEGRPFLTKFELVERYKSWLNDAGTLYLYDDYDFDSRAETEKWLRTWDRRVIEQFSKPGQLDALAEDIPELAGKLKRLLSGDKSAEKVIENVARIRRQRRRRCREETIRFGDYFDRLQKTFGRDNVRKIDYDMADFYPGFHLTKSINLKK